MARTMVLNHDSVKHEVEDNDDRDEDTDDQDEEEEHDDNDDHDQCDYCYGDGMADDVKLTGNFLTCTFAAPRGLGWCELPLRRRVGHSL